MEWNGAKQTIVSRLTTHHHLSYFLFSVEPAPEPADPRRLLTRIRIALRMSGGVLWSITWNVWLWTVWVGILGPLYGIRHVHMQRSRMWWSMVRALSPARDKLQYLVPMSTSFEPVYSLLIDVFFLCLLRYLISRHVRLPMFALLARSDCCLHSLIWLDHEISFAST